MKRLHDAIDDLACRLTASETVAAEQRLLNYIAQISKASAHYQVPSERVLWSASEVLIRPLSEGGFELVVGLPRGVSLKTLQRLAEHKDRAALIESALDQPSFFPSMASHGLNATLESATPIQ